MTTKSTTKPVAFRVTPAPHLRSPASVPKIFWGRAAALLPLLIAFLFLFHVQALRILGVVLITALLTKVGAAMSRRHNAIKLYDGSMVYTALLFSFLVPPTMPSWMMAVGIFVSIFAAGEIFGGLGSYFLNPALVGSAFLQLSFPEMFSNGSFFFVDSATGQWAVLAALGLGGLALVLMKGVDWRVPFFYLTAAVLLEKIFLAPAAAAIPMGRLFFAAFFLMADCETLPLARSGRKVFAILAAAFTLILKNFSLVPLPEVFAVLSVNLLTPWLDQWMRAK